MDVGHGIRHQTSFDKEQTLGCTMLMSEFTRKEVWVGSGQRNRRETQDVRMMKEIWEMDGKNFFERPDPDYER
jgi:hypothetical protein